MNGRLLLGLALFVIALGMNVKTASAQQFVGCPEGEAIRGINLITRRVECVAVGTTQIAALQAAVASLQASLNTLLTYVKVQTGAINGLGGPHVIIEGANLHVRSGSLDTVDATNLGNLVVGYNEPRLGSDTGNRGGSHNLIIGPEHQYTDSGGLVVGFRNSVLATFGSITGGALNTVSGGGTSVTGGSENTASGAGTSVSGGSQNHASGQNTSITGGQRNTASGHFASVTGGFANTASGVFGSVTGGSGNTASSERTSVNGGHGNTAGGVGASVSGGTANTASGQDATVSGGAFRSATGDHDWVAGGLFQDQ